MLGQLQPFPFWDILIWLWLVHCFTRCSPSATQSTLLPWENMKVYTLKFCKKTKKIRAWNSMNTFSWLMLTLPKFLLWSSGLSQMYLDMIYLNGATRKSSSWFIGSLFGCIFQQDYFLALCSSQFSLWALSQQEFLNCWIFMTTMLGTLLFGY